MSVYCGDSFYTDVTSREELSKFIILTKDYDKIKQLSEVLNFSRKNFGYISDVYFYVIGCMQKSEFKKMRDLINSSKYPSALDNCLCIVQHYAADDLVLENGNYSLSIWNWFDERDYYRLPKDINIKEVVKLFLTS